MQRLYTDVGVPIKLKTDMAGIFKFRHTSFQKEVNNQLITHTFGGFERKNQVWKVDIDIQELIKKRWHHKIVTRNFLKKLW